MLNATAPMRLCLRCGIAFASSAICPECKGETLTGKEVRLAIIGAIDGMPRCERSRGGAECPSHIHRATAIDRVLGALALPREGNEYAAWSARFPRLSQRAAAPEVAPGAAAPVQPQEGVPPWRDRLCACGHRRGEHGGSSEAGRCDHGCCSHDCAPSPSAPQPQETGAGARSVLFDADAVQHAMTRAVRAADEAFVRDGGSSRHWIRDHFIPELAKEGLGIVLLDELNRLQRAVNATAILSPQEEEKR